MKRDARAWKLPAVAGAVLLCLGLGVAALSPAVNHPTPPLTDSDSLLATTGPEEAEATIERADITYTYLGVQYEKDVLESGSLDLPKGSRATLYLDFDTSKLVDGKIEIVIPEGLELVDYPEPEEMPALVSAVDTSKFATKNYGGHIPKCGTIVYSVTDAAPHLSLELLIGKDRMLWNSLMVDHVAEPFTVKVYSGADPASPALSEMAVDVTITGTVNESNQLRIYGTNTGVPAASGKDNHFKSRIFRVNITGYSKELSITMALPFNIKQEKYAQFDKVEFPRYNGKKHCLDPSVNTDCLFTTSVDNDNHTVTFTWKNIYLEMFDYFIPYFYWEEGDAPVAGDSITFYSNAIPYVEDYQQEITDNSSSVQCVAGAKRILQSGQEVLIGNTYCTIVTNEAGTKSSPIGNVTVTTKASLTSASATRVMKNHYATDPNLTYCLSALRVKNTSGVNTAPQTVRIAYLNTDKFGVTAQRIPAVPGTKITVKYKTTASPDEFISYPTELSAGENNNVLFTAEMVNLPSGVYFTEIEADVGVIPFGYFSYNELAIHEPMSGGAVFGKILTPDIPLGTYETAGCWWKDTSTVTPSTASPTKSNNPCKVQIIEGATAGLGLVPEIDGEGNEIRLFSEETVTAGETIHANALISLTSVMETSQGQVQFIDDPVICLRFPNDASITNFKLERLTGSYSDAVYYSDGFEGMRDMTGSVVTTPLAPSDYEMSEPIALAEGYALRIVTFKNGAGRLGWFNDDRSQTQLRLSFDVELASSMPSGSMSVRSSVLVRSASLDSYAGVLYSARSKSQDIYGITDILQERGIIKKAVTAQPLSSPEASLMDDTLADGGKEEQNEDEEEEVAAPVYLSSAASTYEANALIIHAARGGNKPTISIGVNGGTAPAGMVPLLLVDENGEVTLPPAPVKEGRTFEGWVSSDGNTYQPGEKMKVGSKNITLAAKWSDEPAPVPDAANPFEFTVNESGVNYGGRAVDPNANEDGMVPESIAQRAQEAAQAGPGDSSFMEQPGDSLGPDGSGGPGADGDGPDGSGGPGAGGSGSGATTVHEYTPLVQTGDSLPVILFLCTGGLALIAMGAAWFVQGRRKQEGE